MDIPDTSSLPPKSGRGPARTLLAGNRDFRLLFTAMLISFAGDWFLFVALTGLVFDLTGSATLVALMYASTTVPFALVSFLGGHLADRLNRRTIMVSADLVRGALALGFLVVDTRSEVWLAFVLAGAIAALGALFQPASSAAVPNLVDIDDLGTANALAGATWGSMLAVGAAAGGLVVAGFGREAAYLTDSVSFLLSALLIVGIRRPMAEARDPVESQPGLVASIGELFRYARGERRVLALLSAKTGFGVAAGMVGLLPLLSLEVFGAGDRGTGFLLAARGVGVMAGPLLVRRLLRPRDLGPLFMAIPVAYGVVGVFYGAASWAPWLLLSGAFIAVSHVAGGAQWTMTTFALQAIVPDRIRGRVFAFDHGLLTFTVAVSATVAGAIAESVDVRVVISVMALLALAYAFIWGAATRGLRREMLAERAAAAAAA